MFPDLFDADDEREAGEYERLWEPLLASRWYPGGCVCQYRPAKAEFPDYAPRPTEARTGIRNADCTERKPLFECFQRMHRSKYGLRAKLRGGSG